MTAEPAQLQPAKEALIAELVQRPEFKSKYDSLSNAVFVQRLLQTARNSGGDQTQLIAVLEAQQKTRAQVVQTIVDDPQTVKAFRNEALVLMQFFANLNRDPEPGEYEAQLNSLNITGDYRQLIFKLHLFSRVPKTLWLC